MAPTSSLESGRSKGTDGSIAASERRRKIRLTGTGVQKRHGCPFGAAGAGGGFELSHGLRADEASRRAPWPAARRSGPSISTLRQRRSGENCARLREKRSRRPKFRLQVERRARNRKSEKAEHRARRSANVRRGSKHRARRSANVCRAPNTVHEGLQTFAESRSRCIGALQTSAGPEARRRSSRHSILKLETGPAGSQPTVRVFGPGRLVGQSMTNAKPQLETMNPIPEAKNRTNPPRK